MANRRLTTVGPAQNYIDANLNWARIADDSEALKFPYLSIKMSSATPAEPMSIAEEFKDFQDIWKRTFGIKSNITKDNAYVTNGLKPGVAKRYEDAALLPEQEFRALVDGGKL